MLSHENMFNCMKYILHVKHVLALAVMEIKAIVSYMYF